MFMKNYDYWTETLFSLLKFIFFQPTQKLSIYLYNAYKGHSLTDWLTHPLTDIWHLSTYTWKKAFDRNLSKYYYSPNWTYSNR